MEKKELLKEIETLRKRADHYETLMDESNDPIFSFLPDGTYRYVNKAFAQGVGKDQDQIIGKTIWDVFEKDEADKRFAVVKKVFSTAELTEIEVRVPLPSGDTYYLTTAKPVMAPDGRVDSVICISKNITRRKKAEIALKQEHESLLKAMEEIKVLSGLLPICASCKKIRDDKGYWNLIESYIEAHSEASFSHGLCPECSKSLYGDKSWFTKRRQHRDPDPC